MPSALIAFKIGDSIAKKNTHESSKKIVPRMFTAIKEYSNVCAFTSMIC